MIARTAVTSIIFNNHLLFLCYFPYLAKSGIWTVSIPRALWSKILLLQFSKTFWGNVLVNSGTQFVTKYYWRIYIYISLYRIKLLYRSKNLWLQHCDNSTKGIKKKKARHTEEMSADQRVNQKHAPWHLVVILRRHRNLILSTIVSLQGPLTGPLLRPTSHTGTNARPRYFLERKLHHDFLTSVASSWVGGNCLGFSSLVEMGILPSLDDKPQGNGGAPATIILSGRRPRWAYSVHLVHLNSINWQNTRRD